MNALKTLIISGILAFGSTLATPVYAQEPQGFSQAELDQMLAPIALYPDTVLSHVLIASTYPLEIVQAARWSRDHPGLSGEEAVNRVEDMDWDPSVKALVAFPDLLARMDEDIGWTQRVGDAFLVQEDQVVETIQHLRGQAYAQGNLQSNEHVQVIRETEYIYIEPARTRVVYVPYYDPHVVYGPWRWAAYPPYYWHHPPGFSISLGFYWGTPYYVPPAFYFSSFHWPRRQVVVVNNYYYDHHYYDHHDRGRRSHHRFKSGRELARYDGARRWQHNPRHRRGVSYDRHVDRSRFVQERHDETARSEPGRAAQPRGKQRHWASDKRDTLALNKEPIKQGREDRQSTEPAGQRATRRPGSRDRAVAAAPRPSHSEPAGARGASASVPSHARSERIPARQALAASRSETPDRISQPRNAIAQKNTLDPARERAERTRDRLTSTRSVKPPRRDERAVDSRAAVTPQRAAPQRTAPIRQSGPAKAPSAHPGLEPSVPAQRIAASPPTRSQSAGRESMQPRPTRAAPSPPRQQTARVTRQSEQRSMPAQRPVQRPPTAQSVRPDRPAPVAQRAQSAPRAAPAKQVSAPDRGAHARARSERTSRRGDR